MNPKVKSINNQIWLFSFPVLGKSFNRYTLASSGRLWEVLKTTFWIAVAITMGLLVGQELFGCVGKNEKERGR